MTFEIQHQARLSRGQLLLRSLFGWIYMYLPHYFVLIFVGLWSGVLTFIAWWIVLFTGRYPRSFFDYQVGYIRWHARIAARYYNLTDGYPEFGIKAKDNAVNVDIPYPESSSRGVLLLRLFFGWLYVGIPHGLVLGFLFVGLVVVQIIGWWTVLFTAQMPLALQNYTVGVFRWYTRVHIYISFLTDTYPPFSLDRD